FGRLAQAEVVDREFQLAGATTLRLNVSGHVHVISDSQASTVKIHVTDYGPSLPALAFKEERTGKRLTVTVAGPPKNPLPFVGASGYEVEVRVPTSTRIDLREFAGFVEVDSVTAPSQYYNADGSIEVADARAKLTAQADAGAIDVKLAHGDLTLSTGTGANSATLASDWRGNLIRMEAGNGAMNLTVPAKFRGNFDVTAADGKVSNALRT